MFKVISLLAAVLCLSSPAFAEQLTFKRAIELALRNSPAAAIADANEKKAKHGYLEMRSRYLPQMTLGSGLAYSNGFPLSIEGSAPSIISLNSQQWLLNFAGRDLMRAAKKEWDAASKSTQDSRAQLILDTALTYAELDKYASSLKIMEQQQQAAQRAEQVAADRFRAGLDPEVELIRARLNAARVRMAAANARGNADLLRLKLSQLTGLAADTIETVTESIPELPQGSVGSSREQLDSHPAVQSSNEVADAREQRAKAERKFKLPTVDLAGQYGLLSRYNNYDKFFQRFQRHNVTIGFVIRFPFLNFAQDARAEAAEAEAVRARKEAQAVRGQMESETLKLQRTVDQLSAARDVAKFEYQIASADARAVQTRAEAGQATVRDQENARLAEHQKYAAFVDAQFELERAQMTLLRQTGQIEKWVGVE